MSKIAGKSTIQLMGKITNNQHAGKEFIWVTNCVRNAEYTAINPFSLCRSASINDKTMSRYCSECTSLCIASMPSGRTNYTAVVNDIIDGDGATTELCIAKKFGFPCLSWAPLEMWNEKVWK